MRKLPRIVALVGLVMALVACQPTTTSTQSPGKESPASGAPAAAKPDGVLRVGTSFWGSGNADPPVAADGEKSMIILTFDWLVGSTIDGNDISKDTGIASNWEESPDGLTWTFYLRKGVQFHDGYGEVTAEDVKFSVERSVYSPNTKVSAASALKALIDKVEVVDPYTVRFRLKKPTLTLAFDLSPLTSTVGIIMPKGYIEKDEGEAFGRHPIGSGPYKFVELVGSSHLKLEALDNHFSLGVPKFKEVYLRLVPEESTRIAQLKTGELDIIDLSPDRVDELKNDFTVVQKDGDSDLPIWLTAQWQGGLADKRVRQAIDLAIDKETLLKTLLRGQGKVLPGFMVSSWALGAKPMQPHPFDPDKARALLKEAGQTNMEIDFPTTTEWQLMTEAIAGQLQKVGFRVKVNPMDYAALSAKYRRLTTTQKTPPLNAITIFPIPNRLLTHSLYTAAFASDGAVTPVQDPKLDKLIKDLGDAKNLDNYAGKVGEIQQYIDKEFIIIPLFQLPKLFAVNPKKVVPWAGGGKTTYEIGLRELVWRKS